MNPQPLKTWKTWRLTITITDSDTGASTSIAGLVDDLEVEQSNDGEFGDFGVSPVMTTWNDGDRTITLNARWRPEGGKFYWITHLPGDGGPA